MQVTLGAVYPVVALAVRSVFDPCSQTMSASLADLISQLLGYDIPLNMSNELFQSLLSKFDASFNSFCFPNLRTNTDADDLSLLICQLWHVHICIRNLGKFKAFLSPSAVTRLIWNLYCSTWSGVIATILTFSSTHIEVLCACRFVYITEAVCEIF